MTKTLLSKHFTMSAHFSAGKSPMVWLDNLGHVIAKELVHSEQVHIITGNTLT